MRPLIYRSRDVECRPRVASFYDAHTGTIDCIASARMDSPPVTSCEASLTNMSSIQTPFHFSRRQDAAPASRLASVQYQCIRNLADGTIDVPWDVHRVTVSQRGGSSWVVLPIPCYRIPPHATVLPAGRPIKMRERRPSVRLYYSGLSMNEAILITESPVTCC